MKFPDRYRDPSKIGQGGMGEIFRVTDTALGRDVAIKMLFAHHAADEEVRSRFTREALAAARLSGEPHTVAIYDVGEAEGRPFIVMEYLPGGSLADRLARGRPSETQALQWIDETARALDAAHGRGVVHRDVKPANLLLDGADHVHVADFGIASAVGLDSNTQTGMVLGTAGYLSPEQAAGGKATPASDVYSLGVVAAELLGSAPPAVERILDRALARDPAARFASAGELAAALHAAYAGVEPPTLVMRRRSPRLAFAVAGLLLLAGGAAAALLTSVGAGGGSSPEPTTPLVRTVTVPAPLPTEPAPTLSAVEEKPENEDDKKAEHEQRKAEKEARKKAEKEARKR